MFAIFFLTDISREELLQRIVSLFKIKLPSSASVSTQQIQDESEQPLMANRQMTLREKLLARHIPNHRTGADYTIGGELIRFQDIQEIYDDVLDFWKKFADHYPNLSAIARALFCVQATTSTAESSFSFAGSVIRSRRATIDPFRVEKVLFIHDNYDLFNI